MIWRTNGEEPRINDWTLVMDKGGGDAKNAVGLTLSVFKDYLYVGTAGNTYGVLGHIIPKNHI